MVETYLKKNINKRKIWGCNGFILCPISFAGYMFLRIPFTLKLQVSMDHESYFMGNLEDRKMKQPYSYYTLRFGADVAAYCWLTWSGKGDRQQLGSQQLQLLLHPPSASLTPGSVHIKDHDKVQWLLLQRTPTASKLEVSRWQKTNNTGSNSPS